LSWVFHSFQLFSFEKQKQNPTFLVPVGGGYQENMGDCGFAEYHSNIQSGWLAEPIVLPARV
jgi:hypothetical protein